MPSKSPAQKRLMAAAAHTSGGFGGVPQSVGKDFNHADTEKTMAYVKGHPPKVASYAQGGAVLGRTKDFMKMPDEFRTDKPTDTADKNYGKSGANAGTGEVKPPAQKMKKNI